MYGHALDAQLKKYLPSTARLALFASVAVVSGFLSSSCLAEPVPGYVPPVTLTVAPEYADDTRGVYVPSHEQYRLMNHAEQKAWAKGDMPSTADLTDTHERRMNRLANGSGNMGQELARIAQDPGVLNGGVGTADVHQYRQLEGAQVAQNHAAGTYSGEFPAGAQPQGYPQRPMQAPQGYQAVPQPYQAPHSVYMPQAEPITVQTADGGVEIAAGDITVNTLDMYNSIVRLQEDRVSVRRALQRMMDQIGGSTWTLVWDLSEQNAALPEMEISIFAEEPFVNVLNALLARMQTRSGLPLRVIKYDQSRRLVITDRTGGYKMEGQTNTIGVEQPDNVVVTERVLKDAMVSLHYDEIPLVDALENIVAQAGKGQWRLRMYAGRDQVLKPAHIEEPLNIALERLLKLFNLKYEIFPGGKLIVVTHASRFGYQNVPQ